jgi:hypothetical protein
MAHLELVWQTTLSPSLFFSLLPKKSNKKHFFSTFYITSVIVYYYPNKKIYYKTKLVHFSINQFQTFLYFIPHQSLFTTIQTNNPQLQPFAKQALISL